MKHIKIKLIHVSNSPNLVSDTDTLALVLLGDGGFCFASWDGIAWDYIGKDITKDVKYFSLDLNK